MNKQQEDLLALSPVHENAGAALFRGPLCNPSRHRIPNHEERVAHWYEPNWHIGSTLQRGPNRDGEGMWVVPACFSARHLSRGKSQRTAYCRAMAAKAGNAAAPDPVGAPRPPELVRAYWRAVRIRTASNCHQ